VDKKKRKRDSNDVTGLKKELEPCMGAHTSDLTTQENEEKKLKVKASLYYT
jgi:hypothetical protein